MQWLYLALWWFLQPGILPSDTVHAVATAGNGDVFVAGSIGGDALLARVAGDSGMLQWEKAYGWYKSDVMYAVGECQDGTVQAAGETWSSGNGLSDAYFLRTDSTGELLWEQDIGGAGLDTVQSFVFVNGGFSAVGSSTSYGGTSKGLPWAVHMSNDGMLVWSQVYNAAGFAGTFHDVVRMRGSVVAVGETYVAPELIEEDSAVQEVLITKITDNGTEVWHKTYLFGYNPEAHAIARMSDGGFVVAGNSNRTPAGDRNAFVLRCTGTGDKLWLHYYGGPYHDEFADVMRLPDGNLIALGTTFPNNTSSGDIWMRCITKTGMSYCDHLFGTLTLPEWGTSITRTTSGMLVVGGSGYVAGFQLK